ncbi:MAG: hypothetical protein J3Q66DRAFT_339991 [Benniella sp.]|nr:MAG: hypothetical protein J3Q66DRAFT_339991 [Benniella sp.]
MAQWTWTAIYSLGILGLSQDACEAENSLLYLAHSRSGYGWTLCQTSGCKGERVSQSRSISGLFCDLRRDEGQ